MRKYLNRDFNHFQQKQRNKILLALVITLFLRPSVDAAEKIRIGFPDLAAQFVPLPLAQKRGFFEEEGLQGEFIRMVSTGGVAALASGEIDYYTSIGVGVTAAIRGV